MKLKKLVRKYTPSADAVSKRGAIRHISHFLLGQNIWHLNRRSVSCAVYVAIFCAMLPIPGQMVVASILALVFRAHLPLSIAGTWITNPVTYMPIFYFNYRLGLLFTNAGEEFQRHSFELSAFYENLHSLLIPLMIGSITTGIVAGFLGFLIVRLYWRIYVMLTWSRRKQRSHDDDI